MKKTISKKSLKSHILSGNSSQEIADTHGCSQNIVTREIKKHFNGQSMWDVKRMLYKKHGKYGQCKMCGSSLHRNQSTYCSNTCKFEDDEYNTSRFNKSKHNDADKKRVCTVDDCNWETSDIHNLSGAITVHLRDQHNIQCEDLDEYATIEDREHEEQLQCGLCDWSTTDVNNNSGALTKHVKNKHGGVIQYCEDIDNSDDTHKNLLKYDERKKKLNDNHAVSCKECGKRLKKITYTHVKMHGYDSVHGYRLAHGLTVSDTYSNTHYKKCKRQYDDHLKGSDYSYTSKMEHEIAAFITDKLDIECVQNDRSIDGVSEVDVHIPSHNIAIEMNGLYYHSERSGKKDKWYHYNKKKACHTQNINLIHIFEDQWNTQQDVIKHRLSHILNMADNRVGARECNVVQPDTDKLKEFLNRIHVRGFVGSSYAVGLEYDNELVACMTFSKARRPGVEWDLNRFCTQSVVYGGASKCFKTFVRDNDPSSVVTYADLLWSDMNGAFYSKLEFNKDGFVDPDYYYVGPSYNHRYHKSGFRKSRLKKKFPTVYEDQMSEKEIMNQVGYDRIYDVGKLRYIWTP